jgi:hypothetical protein
MSRLNSSGNVLAHSSAPKQKALKNSNSEAGAKIQAESGSP